jgi:hypothetical protein
MEHQTFRRLRALVDARLQQAAVEKQAPPLPPEGGRALRRGIAMYALKHAKAGALARLRHPAGQGDTSERPDACIEQHFNDVVNALCVELERLWKNAQAPRLVSGTSCEPTTWFDQCDRLTRALCEDFIGDPPVSPEAVGCRRAQELGGCGQVNAEAR